MNTFAPLLPRFSDSSRPGAGWQHGGGKLRSSRSKITLACTNCRSKKVKCDGREPSCSNCVNLDKPCIYENCDKRNKEGYKSMIDDLEQKIDRLEDMIGSLKCNSLDEAIKRLKHLREEDASPCRLDQVSTVGPNGSFGDEDSLDGVRSSGTNFSGTETISLGERPSSVLSDGSWASVSSIYLDLPPEDVTRHAVSSYFYCGSTLFYVMPQEACEPLIKQIYDHAADVTKSVVCQLCALAAVGSQYCTDQPPDFAKENYFQHALLLLQDAIEQDSLTSLRVSVCLAVYLVLAKNTSARTMTASGLDIARWNMRECMRSASDGDRMEWARVLRTLAFIECWLSPKLGYSFDLRPSEMILIKDLAVSESVMNPGGVPNSGMIQYHTYKIALLSAQVHKRVNLATHFSRYELEEFSANLDIWNKELPECLHLRSLTSGDGATCGSTRRPLLFMHMVHISSRITLYEHLFRVTLNRWISTSDQSVTCEVIDLPEDTHQIYGSFAQQLARIIGLLHEEESVFKRCWLTIHACFHSSLVLLLRAAQQLAHVNSRDLVLQNLFYARISLRVLGICEEQDIATMRLYDLVTPIYQRLQHIVDHHVMSGGINSKSLIADADDGPTNPAQLSHIVFQLLDTTTRYQELWV